jgi:serine/threonine-protein kinase
MSDIEELYERARAMLPEERSAFLNEACQDDPRMARELRSLLEHGDAAEAFFEKLAGAVTSPAIGEQVSHYRLTGILGSGGMGTVYRAHDTRLDRIVALKFLPLWLSAVPKSRERFLVEARAAASLEHSNVCSVHEIGETTDGRPYIAMACYEGETLKERLRRGPLPPEEALQVALQVARGLGAAHARGIVHRDVKPGNIMLVADGSVRLLDFGIAKMSDVTLTAPGATPGTLSYMSPEQARGEHVGPAADLWSLGVVLYEMLAGIRPFRGGNDRAVVQAIVHDQPDLAALRNIPPRAVRIVKRLLQKAPADRFPGSRELIAELTGETSSSHQTNSRGWARKHARQLALGGVAILAIVAIALALTRPGHHAAAADTVTTTPTIAVLPFTVRGSDLDVWGNGMVDLLSMGLDGAAGVRAIDSRTLLAAWHEDVGDTATPDLAHALAVARRTQARYALVGSMVGTGPSLRLAADLYDVGSGRTIGPVQVDGPRDSVLTLVDRLGMQALGLLLARDSARVPALHLAAITTSSLIALKAYLEGDEHYRRSEFRDASDSWERAVQADSTFALAYVGLADSYAWYAPFRVFEQNLSRAHALETRLPERERTRVRMRWARYIQEPDAVATVKAVIRRYPDAADAWYELGEAYFHDAVATGSPVEIEAAFRKAVELQPAMAPYRAHLVDLAFLWRPDSARIAAELGGYSRLAPDEAHARAGRLAFALAYGATPARDSARAALGTLDGESAYTLYNLLQHPRFADIRALVFPAIEPRLDATTRATVLQSLLFNLGFVDGHLRTALAILADTTTPVGFRVCGPVYYAERDLPVPPDALARSRAIIQADTSLLHSAGMVRCAAELAAWFGDWREHAALVTRARVESRSHLANGDSSLARVWELTEQVAEGFGLMKRGRTAEAWRTFERVLPRDAGGDYRWYAGLLPLQLGKLHEAERGFRALWAQRDAVPARLRLARILEQQGQAAEAREEYEFVIQAWRHADPELQPMVDEARLALLRLMPAGSGGSTPL